MDGIMSSKKWNRFMIGCYCAACITLVFLAAYRFKNIYQEYNDKQMETVLGLIAEKVNVTIESVVDEATQITKVAVGTDQFDARKTYDRLQTCLEGSPYTGIGIWLSEDEFVGRPGDKLDMDKYGFPENCLASGEVYVTEPYRSYGTAAYQIAVLVPVYENEVCQGIVIVSFPIQVMQDRMGTMALDYQPEIWLINAEAGNLIACTDSMFLTAGNWSNLILLKGQLEFERDEVYYDYQNRLRDENCTFGTVRFSWNGENYIQGYVQIEKMPEWYIAVNTDAGNLTVSLISSQTSIMLYGGIFLGLTVLLLVWFVIRAMVQKKKLKTLSDTDVLTGIPNKRSFMEQFEKIEQKSDASGVLIFIDVDDFKFYNDTYGHLIGDEVLKEVAKALKEFAGEDGLASRYGGDEFVAFLKEKQEREEVEKRLEKMQNRLRELQIDEIGNVRVTCSIGMACLQEDGGSYEKLCEKADQALYHVKEHGKDAFAWCGDVS